MNNNPTNNDNLIESTSIPTDQYNYLRYLGLLDSNETRMTNVGDSNYSKNIIQPWTIWLAYPDLNPFDCDIIKRVLREKHNLNANDFEILDARIEDYHKIIHICNERVRQLKCQIEQYR